jgi:hypothetical protein
VKSGPGYQFTHLLSLKFPNSFFKPNINLTILFLTFEQKSLNYFLGGGASMAHQAQPGVTAPSDLLPRIADVDGRIKLGRNDLRYKTQPSLFSTHANS